MSKKCKGKFQILVNIECDKDTRQQPQKQISGILRSKELIAVTIIFPVYYLAFCFCFLHNLYELNLLFSWTGSDPTSKSLYFSQDVFDVFWLIIAAIPNGIFSYYLYRDILLTFRKKGSPLVLIHFLIIVVLILCALIYTGEFNKNYAVWSSELPRFTNSIYVVLELVSVLILSAELSSVLFGTAAISHCGYLSPDKQLPYRIFISSIILFFYWFMLILSGIINDKCLEGRAKSPGLFPVPYFFAGLGVAVILILSFHIFFHDPNRKKVTPSFLLGSIIIPAFAIVLQIFQLIS